MTWGEGKEEIIEQHSEYWQRVPEQVLKVAERLRTVVLSCGDYTDLFPKHDAPDTLWYCDPPYLASTRSDYDRYLHEFNRDEQHERLAEMLHALKGMVLLSGFRSALYDRLYEGWSCIRIGRGSARTTGEEVVWLNDAAQAGRWNLINSAKEGV